jgi:hypothetical protein
MARPVQLIELQPHLNIFSSQGLRLMPKYVLPYEARAKEISRGKM